MNLDEQTRTLELCAAASTRAKLARVAAQQAQAAYIAAARRAIAAGCSVQAVATAAEVSRTGLWLALNPDKRAQQKKRDKARERAAQSDHKGEDTTMSTISNGSRADRLALADRQPDADACSATLAAPFHGRTATELRRLYVEEFGGRSVPLLAGEELVQAVRDTWNARHP